MISKRLFLFFFFIQFHLTAQELRVDVNLDAGRMSSQDTDVYNALEDDIRNLLNEQSWSDREYEDFQKIEVKLSIIINAQPSPNRFNCTAIIVAKRPIYGTSLSTSLLNFSDSKFNFDFQRDQNLFYNENDINSDLVALLSFYAQLILGIDAESFESESGKAFFDKAQVITDQAVQNNFSGWERNPFELNRLNLIGIWQKPSTIWFRELWYNYHRMVLDQLYDKRGDVQLELVNTLKVFDRQNRSADTNLSKRLFFDSKVQESVWIAKNGSDDHKKDVLDALKRNASSYREYWKELE